MTDFEKWLKCYFGEDTKWNSKYLIEDAKMAGFSVQSQSEKARELAEYCADFFGSGRWRRITKGKQKERIKMALRWLKEKEGK